MAKRVRIPIDNGFYGVQKEKHEAIDRLLKERYANPVYEIGQIIELVSKSLDPLEIQDLERKLIVEPYSFDEYKKIGENLPNNEESYDIGHEDVTSYIIGVKKGFESSVVFKKGDIIEIQIVSNEITKRNAVDGFYVSTLQESDGIWNYIEGATYPLVEMYRDVKNKLTDEKIEQLELTDEILKTKKEVDAYKNGALIGKIEVVTLEGKQVEIKTVKAYITMKNEAAKEGINLSIRSGYRPMQEQIQIYNSRYEPDYSGGGSCRNMGENISGTFQKAVKVAQNKGVVAYPGCSNHQNGKALDIVNTPQNVSWLMSNAKRFGFYNTVKSENWHWEYLG